jgi:hypothetical protein
VIVKIIPEDDLGFRAGWANKKRIWLNGCEVISLTRRPQNSTSPVWTDDDLPACPVGMDLLRRFEAARPNDYDFLQVQDFADLRTSAFDGIPEWDAFTAH